MLRLRWRNEPAANEEAIRPRAPPAWRSGAGSSRALRRDRWGMSNRWLPISSTNTAASAARRSRDGPVMSRSSGPRRVGSGSTGSSPCRRSGTSRGRSAGSPGNGAVYSAFSAPARRRLRCRGPGHARRALSTHARAVAAWPCSRCRDRRGWRRVRVGSLRLHDFGRDHLLSPGNACVDAGQGRACHRGKVKRSLRMAAVPAPAPTLPAGSRDQGTAQNIGEAATPAEVGEDDPPLRDVGLSRRLRAASPLPAVRRQGMRHASLHPAVA